MASKQKYLTSPITAAIAAALYPNQQAVAQDQEAASSLVLEEVLVTAQRREVAMQDLPQSIQAFTTEEIARNAFADFVDVANAIPSLTLIQDMPGRNSVKFRGVSTGTGEYYTDSTSSIYLDETPLTFNSQQLFPAMVDIERVEALPGPQGTLFGASSLAGTLRIITNKPDPSQYSGEVFAEYYATKGGSGSWALNGHINIPLISDTLALRLVAHTRKDGGWIDNVYGEAFAQPDPRFQAPGNNAAFVENDWNEFKLTGGRAALRWDINEDWATTLSFISEKNEADGNWSEDTGLGDDTSAIFHDEFRDDEWWNVSLLIEGDLGFATLTSSTTYLDREITYEWENMVYEQYKDRYWGKGYWAVEYYPNYEINPAYYGFVLYDSEYTYGWTFNDQTQDRFSQEIRLTSSSDSRFQWMVGAFYEEINDKWYYGAANPDMVDTVMWYYANYWAYYYNYYGYDVDYPLAPTIVGYSETLDRTVEQLAFFGEMSYDFTDKWSATVGARWFEFKRDQLLKNQFPEGLPPWGTFDTDGVYIATSKNDDVAWKFSTQYFFTDDVMGYLLFSQGFRNGGNNSARAANTGLVPFTYDPDFVNNWELGMKSQWLDNSLQLNLTLFYLDWQDRQFNEYGGGALPWWLSGSVNAGDTETTGMEVSFTWRATERLRLEGNLAWLDAEAASTYEFLSGTVMQPGDPLPNAPELGYWLAADYTFPMKVFGGDLWARVDYAYGDEYWNSTTNAIERNPEGLIPDWNNTNLQVGLELPDNWTITAYVNNLTDEERVTTRQNNTYASDRFNTTKYAFWEYQIRPRHYGISVRKRFD